MTDNKIIHACSKCSKSYKSSNALQKHTEKCKVESTKVTNNISLPKPTTKVESMSATNNTNNTNNTNIPNSNENIYDVNMTFGEGNKVQVDIKKQANTVDSDDSDSDVETGDKVLKDILRPKVSHTYQDEIDKLESLVKMFKTLPISDDPAKKDHTIEQLKQTVTILMTQSRNLIKEMKQMSRRNSYYKNNIMLAAFILDNCRKDVPETDEEFETMFS